MMCVERLLITVSLYAAAFCRQVAKDTPPSVSHAAVYCANLDTQSQHGVLMSKHAFQLMSSENLVEGVFVQSLTCMGGGEEGC